MKLFQFKLHNELRVESALYFTYRIASGDVQHCADDERSNEELHDAKRIFTCDKFRMVDRMMAHAELILPAIRDSFIAISICHYVSAFGMETFSV